MKHSKLFLMFLFLSLKGLSQQAVLTSSGEKVILNFLSSSGGTITGTLGVTGNTTISGTLTTGTVTYPNTLGTNGQTLTVSGTALTWKTSTAAVSAVFLPTIVIGTQQWMEKNLDVLTYRNGEVIAQITNTTEWANATTGAWCYYSNDAANGAIYGKLYNWHAVNDERGLAPQGWHIPTDAEWTTLGSLLGGNAAAGGKMKTIGTAIWTSNTNATNESGFAGLPDGIINNSGTFSVVGYYGYWSATTDGVDNASYFNLGKDDGKLDKSSIDKNAGFSVRCIRD